MSAIQPVALYAMRIPPGDFLIPAVPEHAAMVNVTMASIDPTEEPNSEDVEDKTERSTLKVVRLPFDDSDDDEDDSEDDEDYTDEESEGSEDSDDELNGGPSDPKRSKKSEKQALLEALAADEDEDLEDLEDLEDEDEDDLEGEAKAVKELGKVMKAVKGKAKAVDGEEDSEEDDDSDELGDLAIDQDEVVVCTLDPKQHYQQSLNFTIGEGEKVYFRVTGTHTVHLTGNYMIPEDDGRAALYDEDVDEDDYDLSPTEDELSMLDALADGGSESDELDDIEDPRLMEVDSEEEAPKLIKDTGKGKNKRLAQDSEEEEEATLDDIIAKSVKKDDSAPVAAPQAGPATNGETKKLTKAEKKRLKKLKKNDGGAAPAPDSATPSTDGAKDIKKDSQQTNGTSSAEKKVQFAKNLEQGPSTSSQASSNIFAKPDTTSKQSTNVINKDGVKIDIRKPGNGPAAKKGSKLELRYIGKLADGKVFDENKKGKPFSVKLGAGEVIKGWDIGLEGIQVGGERRITIPPKHGYGNKKMGTIPAGSELIFDVKCLTVT